MQVAHFLEADLQPWAAALAAALFAPEPAQSSQSAAGRPGRKARGAPRRSAPERKSLRLASRGVRSAPARSASAAAAAGVSCAARCEAAWWCLEELTPLDSAVDAVLRAAELPLLEQLPRTPAAWRPAAIGSRADAGVLELSYRELAACCDAMHAVRGVHTLTVCKSFGASEHPREPGTGERACAALSSLSMLRTLRLRRVSSQAWDDAAAVRLAPALPRLTQLEELALRWGSFHDPAVLARPLGLITTLTRLELYINAAHGQESARVLASGLTCLSQLADLTLCIRGDRVDALARPLGTLTTLTSLDLSCDRISGTDVEELALGLRHLSRLAALRLTASCVIPCSAAALAPALSRLTALSSLKLSGIYDGAVLLAAPALSCLSQLEDLRMTRQSAAGSSVLAPRLALLTALTQLDVGGNQLGADDAASLAPALSCLSHLAGLQLTANELGADGAAALAPPLALLTALTLLHLDANELGADGAIALAPALSRLSRLAELCVDKNELDAAGAAALAAPIALLTALTALHLDDNDVGAEGAASLAPALSPLSRLVTLSLGCNGTGAAGAAALAPALGHLTCLLYTSPSPRD